MAKEATRSKLLAVLEVTLFLAVLMTIAHLALPKGPRWLRRSARAATFNRG